MRGMIYIFALGLAMSSSAQAQRIYFSTEPATGKKDIVSVEVPTGWVQSTSPATGVNANQVLFKADAASTNENGMIYIQTLPLDATLKTPQEIVAHEKMMNTTSKSKVNEYGILTTEKKNALADVVRIVGSVDGHLLTGYIPMKHGVVAVTHCTDDEKFLNKHAADFEALVQSYQLNPIINPPAFAEVVIE